MLRAVKGILPHQRPTVHHLHQSMMAPLLLPHHQALTRLHIINTKVHQVLIGADTAVDAAAVVAGVAVVVTEHFHLAAPLIMTEVGADSEVMAAAVVADHSI